MKPLKLPPKCTFSILTSCLIKTFFGFTFIIAVKPKSHTLTLIISYLGGFKKFKNN